MKLNTIRANNRLDIKRLVNSLLLSLIFPMLVCISVDIIFDFTPLLTMIGGLLFIPLSVFVVMRAVLSEFDRVIQEVAPDEDEHSEQLCQEEILTQVIERN